MHIKQDTDESSEHDASRPLMRMAGSVSTRYASAQAVTASAESALCVCEVICAACRLIDIVAGGACAAAEGVHGIAHDLSDPATLGASSASMDATVKLLIVCVECCC